jgi:DNA-binding XRE family transcriptional regulator
MIANIETLRKEKKLTQDEIAKYLWITRQTFSKLEKGSIEPTLWQAVKLAELLWVDIDNFIETDTKTIANKPIDWEKYKQIITNFIKFWSDDDWKITKTKLAKLCYLLDFGWYYYNLEAITGLEYKKFAQWPVPDEYFSTLDELFEEWEINVKIKWPAYLIENIENPNYDKLSEDEFKMLQDIAKKWKWKKTQEIVDFTHKQLPWMICYNKEVIPYGLITQEEIENVY